MEAETLEHASTSQLIEELERRDAICLIPSSKLAQALVDNGDVDAISVDNLVDGILCGNASEYKVDSFVEFAVAIDGGRLITGTGSARIIVIE